MKELIQLWDYFGINVDFNVPQSPIFWFAVCVLIFSILALLSFIQILFYLVVIYISDHPILLVKI